MIAKSFLTSKLALSLFLMSSLPTLAQEIEGQFVALPGVQNETKSGIWIIDTHTGEVKYCVYAEVRADTVMYCTEPKDED